jgi:hypothetical protein
VCRGDHSYAAPIPGLYRPRCRFDRNRAEFLSQVQAGTEFLVAGPCHACFLAQAECFPRGKAKDQSDAAVVAFTRPTNKSAYDIALLSLEPGQRYRWDRDEC